MEERLRDHWSPQQIARRLEAEACVYVSHESIYQHIYKDKHRGGVLFQFLRCQKKRRKRYGSGRQRRGHIPGRRCISERPATVEQRLSIGDWEADTIVGKGRQQAIVSLVERHSRFTVLKKVERATADAVKAAVKSALAPHRARVHSITADNGKEFAGHQEIARTLQAEFYFAHPFESAARDEGQMVEAWKRAAPDELEQYARMGTPFRDPTGYITFRAATEAAEFFDAPALAAPIWQFIEEQLPHYGDHGESCGGRYILQLFEQTHDRKYLDAVTNYFASYRVWRHEGVYINQPDYGPGVPQGGNPDDLPPLVRDNLWTWSENGANLGDTAAYFSRVTGDPTWQENAVTHILRAHDWLSDNEWSLWRHVGRPDGPDTRSAIWARGVVWFLYGVHGLLEDLPADHASRSALSECLCLGWQGLKRVQREDGLWSNVLNASWEDSRAESSCTAHFIEIYGRAYWRGWLRDEEIPTALERAWASLKTKVWDNRMISYCVGTGFGLNRHVYLSRPHDSNRTSRSNLLWAWIELQRMRRCL